MFETKIRNKPNLFQSFFFSYSNIYFYNLFLFLFSSLPFFFIIIIIKDGATALAHYTERFRQMPTTSGTVSLNNVENGKAPNTWYYSWNAGLVHYVAMSTEIPFGISGNGPDLQGAQYEWVSIQSDAGAM